MKLWKNHFFKKISHRKRTPCISAIHLKLVQLIQYRSVLSVIHCRWVCSKLRIMFGRIELSVTCIATYVNSQIPNHLNEKQFIDWNGLEPNFELPNSKVSNQKVKTHHHYCIAQGTFLTPRSKMRFRHFYNKITGGGRDQNRFFKCFTALCVCCPSLCSNWSSTLTREREKNDMS